jgi:hypothetical protein
MGDPGDDGELALPIENEADKDIVIYRCPAADDVSHHLLHWWRRRVVGHPVGLIQASSCSAGSSSRHCEYASGAKSSA